MNLITIVQLLSNVSGIPAVIAGRTLRPAIWYCVLASLVFDINSLILREKKVNWLLGSNTFFLLEFVALSVFFIGEVFPAKFSRQLYFLAGVIVVYFIIHTSVGNVHKANYMGAAVLCGIYILCCIYGLYKVILEIEYVMVERNPLFIFCVAILLYASGSFVIFLFEKVMGVRFEELLGKLWVYVHDVLNILKNLLIAYGLVLTNKKKWAPSS